MENRQRVFEDDTKVFGFWIYLMTDLVVFAVLFASFAVLRKETFGGPPLHELFELPLAFAETLILLTSSFTCSLATLALYRNQRRPTLFWFAVTFLLGTSFLSIELAEFAHFIAEGAIPERSAALSSFFTLVGTHGFHISIGLIWMAVAMLRISLYPLVSSPDISRILRLAYFWHFLDVVWIFIFTDVYAAGKLL